MFQLLNFYALLRSLARLEISQKDYVVNLQSKIQCLKAGRRVIEEEPIESEIRQVAMEEVTMNLGNRPGAEYLLLAVPTRLVAQMNSPRPFSSK